MESALHLQPGLTTTSSRNRVTPMYNQYIHFFSKSKENSASSNSVRRQAILNCKFRITVIQRMVYVKWDSKKKTSILAASVFPFPLPASDHVFLYLPVCHRHAFPYLNPLELLLFHPLNEN